MNRALEPVLERVVYNADAAVRFTFTKALESKIRKVAKQHKESREHVIRVALAATEDQNQSRHDYIADEYLHVGDDIRAYFEGRRAPARRIANRQEAQRYSSLLLSSFQEVLDYDPAKHHNQKPPILWVDDARYVSDVRVLVAELKKLNTLAKTKQRSEQLTKAATSLSTLFIRFLHSYTKALGKIAAGLTVGAIVGLLYHLGIGKEVIDGIWAALKRGK